MTGESITAGTPATVRLVVTGGGTGGHVAPIVAVIEQLRATTNVECLWIGSKTGVERDAAHRLGVEFAAVHTGKLRRYASLATLSDTFRVPAGAVEAFMLLRRYQPAVTFSSGGFVGVPAVVAGRFLGIPSLTHEQTAYRGLATRINSRFSDVIALSFPPDPPMTRLGRARVVVTGNPVRRAVLNGRADRGRAAFGLTDERPLVYITGGAQGAQAINRRVEVALPALLEIAQVVHQCGPAAGNGDYPRLLAARTRLPDELAARYHVVETVGDEINDLYAASSLVVGRSGAGTVTELATLGIPSILVPLPGAEEQRRNAQALVQAGGAVIVDQKEATPYRVVELVRTLLADEVQLRAMGTAARAVAARHPAERLVEELLPLVRRVD